MKMHIDPVRNHSSHSKSFLWDMSMKIFRQLEYYNVYYSF